MASNSSYSLKDCNSFGLGLIRCPPVLFALLGIVTIVAIIATYMVASRYEDERIVVGSTSVVAVLFITIGKFITDGFARIIEANRMKTEFISIISHQLRSPLSVFGWILDATNVKLKPILKDLEPDKREEVYTLFVGLEKANKEMIRLVDSLLDISRIEANTLVLNPSPFSLEKLTKGIVEEYKEILVRLKLEVRINTLPDLPKVFGDADRIDMVIRNLLENAISYSNPSTVISISIYRRGGYIYWSIKDRGIGIPKDQQKRIFQKFFRASNARRHFARGNGIGLYAAKSIIEASGGKIGFFSAENRGSVFWFSLPIYSSN